MLIYRLLGFLDKHWEHDRLPILTAFLLVLLTLAFTLGAILT